MASTDALADAEQHLTEEELAYNSGKALLRDAKFLAPQLTSIPTLVALDDVVQQLHFGYFDSEDEDDDDEEEEHDSDEMSTTTNTRTNSLHHQVLAKVDELERKFGTARQASPQSCTELNLESQLVCQLTQSVIPNCPPLEQASDALDALTTLGQSIPRRVCQHPFLKNDLVWVCRTCQADETCVLCHACYSQSNHEGHDVAFYHAHQGGCCDCGDPDAWDPAGFCPHHGPNNGASEQDRALLFPNGRGAVVDRVRGVVTAAAEWLVECAVQRAKQGHERTKGGHVAAAMSSPSAPFHENDGEIDEDDNDDMQVSMAATTVVMDHGRVFLPSAASASKSRDNNQDSPRNYTLQQRQPPSKAEELGLLGREEHGLYLVIHADEIHNMPQWVEALREALGGSPYFADSSLAKVVQLLRKHGQLVLVTGLDRNVLSLEQLHCWMDGDRVASSQVGALLLDKAAKLSQKGLISSISTRQDLQWEQRAVAVLEWLTAVARSCDPLCQTVAESILTEHLIPVLQAVFDLSARITKAWQSLLLALLAVPAFKSHLAAAYCDTYQDVTAAYARGMGVYERSGYTLSVQFLNRVTYVVNLVQNRNLLGRLGKSLLETFQVASRGRRLNPNHYCLNHRRYTPCISDLKCVLNVKGMAKLFTSTAGTFLDDWIASLSLAQWMDPQVWRTYAEGHVETESRGWVAAFNASISLASLFDRLLMWDDDDQTTQVDASESSMILAAHTQSGVDLTIYCMRALEQWHNQEVTVSTTLTSLTPLYPATPNSAMLEDYRKCPASLPVSTVAFKRGAPLCIPALPISQTTPWSFHLPLHRFVATCLREVCRRPVNGMDALLQKLQQQQNSFIFGSNGGFMEFPVLVVSRAAQVRADLWKRNGSRMDDQVLNYSEPPFCRSLRDADILLLQFGTLGRGPADLVHLLVHRFGLFEFLGFAQAPDENRQLYAEQVSAGRFPRELKAEEDDEEDDDEIALPWSYTPAKDVSYALSLLEEFLYLLIVLISELPAVPPASKVEHTEQAKQRLRREVIHRLASGPKTHSELNEAHQVLSQWDNVFLSEEGKQLNPDDAHGACLGRTLDEIAERKSGTLGPDRWELKRSAWQFYDPAFYHSSLRSHQSAAESRPKFPSSSSEYGVEPRPYAPTLSYVVHPSFLRLRRDLTADASVASVLYRTLHVHCTNKRAGLYGVRGQLAYDASARSETALSRAIHFLTIGVMAWEDATSNDSNWQSNDGASYGSLFFERQRPPSLSDWVAAVLLSNPVELTDSDWYAGEENALQLMKRIAEDGGGGGFVAQDQALRAGAAWICEYAMKHNEEAAILIGRKADNEAKQGGGASSKAEMLRKRKEAQARAMSRMNAQAAKFAAALQAASSDEDDDTEKQTDESDTESRQSRTMSVSSMHSFLSAGTRSPGGSEQGFSSVPPSPEKLPLPDPFDDKNIPPRLLKNRPQCIICNEETIPSESDATRSNAADANRKRSRRRSNDSTALAFVAYAQPSTTVKGGGGLPSSINDRGEMAAVHRFVGVHVALCGHAVHGECLDAYLETASQWEHRHPRRKDEFKCPLCQRLSNSLIPLIDVGVDWIDSPYCLPLGENDMTVDDSEGTGTTLNDFLSNTPWWVGRADPDVMWDGQAAFIVSPSSTMDTNDSQDAVADTPRRRRSVRPLRKKDLYAAWNAMMRTPRFVRRRNLRRDGHSRSESIDETQAEQIASAPQLLEFEDPSSSSAGETVVWRRFMDLNSEMSFKADGKRLGEQQLLQFCGEFRHYQNEKAAHNVTNRATGKEHVDWPTCISASPFTETHKQELSREKLLSKLLLSIQTFTYTCSSEVSEGKRLIKKQIAVIEERSETGASSEIKSLYSKFGILGLACDDRLVLMPPPQPDHEDGTQPFEGRLGRLRYFGLAVMAAAGAVSADLVQLVLELPLSSDAVRPQPEKEGYPVHRAPVVFPILFGQVLTHVVAAMCAACGRARARSDALDVVWPVPFSREGSFIGATPSTARATEMVEKDCAGFIKLGLLARILQVLLGSLEIQPGFTGAWQRALFIQSLRQGLQNEPELSDAEHQKQWFEGCYSLLEAVLTKDLNSSTQATDSTLFGSAATTRFKDACLLAAAAAASYLTDVGAILQILIPGAVGIDSKQPVKQAVSDEIISVNELLNYLGLEQVHDMTPSPLTRQVVGNWFERACRQADKGDVSTATDDLSALIQSRLFRTEGFHVYDWPMETSRLYDEKEKKDGAKKRAISMEIEPQHDEVAPMEVDSAGIAELLPKRGTSPLVSFSSKKAVPLLGGYASADQPLQSYPPRIYSLPTSYTDLYAELAALCPDCEQIGLCLICGEVLNAGGKGQCTRHSYKCGGGSCIFFLLQDCQSLILHGNKAAYIQSPYVDSHGETPYYRGRPLNLDLDRYAIFESLWRGHTVRQKVMQERHSARQLIISDFF